MAYAMRRHNARMGHNTFGMIILQNVLEDWTSMRYDLLLERTAAVVHVQAVLMTSSILHKWKTQLAKYPDHRELYNHVRTELRDALDLRDDIWEMGGYNVASADQGLYEAIEMRNRTFSCIHDFVTTASASEIAQGAADVVHIPRWDEPLQPKDGRNPPALAVSPSWDPHPIVMMNSTQMAAEEERRRREAASQPQPEAKARPTSHGGGAPTPTGSAGASAKPPPKARPTQPPTPPDWVIAKTPNGYTFKTSTNPDHRGSLFMTSAWMNCLDQFLLSIMQGPAASPTNITGWAQYLRRVSAYGCMIFGVCNPAVVTDDDAAKISEADWLKCYSHLVRTHVLAMAGCYLSTAGLLMMLGKHDNEVANASGLGRIKKNISNPLACKILETPHASRESDTLAGEFRHGTTILITDLMFRVGTQTGCHDMGMGLADMGWAIELFKVHESDAERPIQRFLETMERVTDFLKNQVADEGNLTVHIWLSMQFLHELRPPHHVLLEGTFTTQFVKGVTDLDQLISRPVIVAINTDSMFNCVDSITSRTAVEMTERLKAQGVMVTTDRRMWRSMYSQFGRQFPILNTNRKGSLGKTAIWSVIEKNLFRQRVFLMCATNREHVACPQRGCI